VTPIETGCGLPLADDCGEFFQDGSTVTVDGVQGEAFGNRFTGRAEEPVSETTTLIIEYDLTLATDGESFSGIVSVSFEDPTNPLVGCTDSWTIEGTRVADCVVEQRRAGGTTPWFRQRSD
ncbi:MAG: hypothetical protein M8861_05195, partial [marine benthic group bacterium]|nr:hypothetical protein [Gemmatimonadota bacterium]